MASKWRKHSIPGYNIGLSQIIAKPLTAKQISTEREAAPADWNFRQTALQFARQGYTIRGTLDAALLSRTTEDGTTVAEAFGEVVGLGGSDAARPSFSVLVQGRLGLVCQSCSVGFELPVDSMSTIYVARDAAEIDAWEEESFESLEATEKTSALELVEDELLLAIPYVPRCKKCSVEESPNVYEFN
ncbi:MAG: hypothetical protein EAZ21_15330 [Betaproteobacteria bacterium]|nr:MAG: hypothetical protein EAZ21_15330 [Betaproteobacteria bacterium]